MVSEWKRARGVWRVLVGGDTGEGVMEPIIDCWGQWRNDGVDNMSAGYNRDDGVDKISAGYDKDDDGGVDSLSVDYYEEWW
jgi:hypothetical protein